MENTKSNHDSDFNEFMDGVVDENNVALKHECENLLQSSSLNHDMVSDIEKELWYYSEEELNKLKANLYMNQVDRINAGFNYSQTDIKNKLKEIQ